MRENTHTRVNGSRLIRTRPGRPFGTVAVIATWLLTIGLPGAAYAQQDDSGSGTHKIDRQHRLAIIDSVSQALSEVYVFPDVARAMAESLQASVRRGDYDDLTALEAFTDRLTEDMHAISQDRHLWVRPTEPRTAAEEDPEAEAERRRQWQDELRFDNYGFRRIEILPENVGYVDLRGFMPAEHGGATAVAAMNFLGSADALIFDLRQNGGGSPSMIQLITSYLVAEPTHLNSFYIRREDTTHQFWTSAYVQGPRLTNVPVYVLTSQGTFSAAEEFTYNLKNLKRATIVGETTGGGAHPVERHWFRIDDDVFIAASIPFGRAINPITGTNWEGTGVAPDIDVPAERALDAARLDYMTKRLETEPSAERKTALEWQLRALEARRTPITLDTTSALEYVGAYGPRVISFEAGELYYQREGRPRYRLFPMGEDMFGLKDLDSFRLQFARDEQGHVNEVFGLYDDGTRDSSKRDP